ncbi:hypothetical protein N2K95_00145 [Arthrobacter zhaoxinii]|uniref:SdpI family protein n=1 Tax=Arthrobacter zhaoxinii TaxID=2964616 RepID=A0ABY5YQ07_9MICC|nr:hypothetical protein [Arthrobacter zhaoxinii]UWX97164.1 hypothetical protein N2K95_00145 [Arthrobacter zhaoxinii]
MSEDTFLALILIPFGVLVMVPGLLVYNGRFRHYRKGLNTMWTGEPALASAYLGAALAGIPVMGMVIRSDNLQMFGLLLVPAVFLSLAIGILGNLWMPRFMKPRWIKEADDAAKRQRRVAKALASTR